MSTYPGGAKMAIELHFILFIIIIIITTMIITLDFEPHPTLLRANS